MRNEGYLASGVPKRAWGRILAPPTKKGTRAPQVSSRGTFGNESKTA